ncbi:MAG TPA: tyrosine-type recombinase/integrase [Clostridia bacterium]|nr:tyrosine-type recombinase/integrase [Clostridia bacterium]
MVTLFTGMREGEICGLSWDCVNFENGTITVKQQLSKLNRRGAEYKLAKTKNSKTRIITPAPSVIAILKNVKRFAIGEPDEGRPSMGE